MCQLGALSGKCVDRIRVNNTLEQQVLLEMRRDLHSKLLRLPVSFYDQRKSGEISSRVIEDVAAGAGLVLRNISLNRQLEQRAQEVRQSRRRLISAQDAEAHRLERNLHDGAQQQVVALKVKLGLGNKTGRGMPKWAYEGPTWAW